MSELVSVIVPVFNVAPYLERCVRAIVEQTYKNLEIILVDDGSTDDSGRLCDQWANIDSRIKVIHQKNAGLSGARNAGLVVARGTWVTFWDSDDWTESEIIEKAVDSVRGRDCDVVIWGYVADFVDKEEHILSSRSFPVPDSLLQNGLTAENAMENDVQGIHGYAWNKIYRRNFLQKHKLAFLQGVYLIEDMLFNLEILKPKASILYLPEIATHYIQRERETLGTKYHPDNFELRCQVVEGWNCVLERLGASENQRKNFVCRGRFNALCSAVRAIIRAGYFSKTQKREMIKKLLKEEKTKQICVEYSPDTLKKHIFYFLIRHELTSLLFVIEYIR